MKAKLLFYVSLIEIFFVNLWLKIAPKIGDAFLWVVENILDNWRAVLAFFIGYGLGG